MRRNKAVTEFHFPFRSLQLSEISSEKQECWNNSWHCRNFLSPGFSLHAPFSCPAGLLKMPRRGALPVGTLLVLLQLAFVPSPLAGCLLDPCLEVCELQVSTKSFCFSGVTFPFAWGICASSLVVILGKPSFLSQGCYQGDGSIWSKFWSQKHLRTRTSSKNFFFSLVFCASEGAAVQLL